VARLDEVRINGVVVLFTLGSAIFSTLIFSLVPALQVTRPNLNASLQEGNRGGASRESQRLRGTLVVSQVALSLLLLAGAGLLIKSFGNLRATNPGFDPAQVMDFVLPGAVFRGRSTKRIFRSSFPNSPDYPAWMLLAAPRHHFQGDSCMLSRSRAGCPGQGNHADASRIVARRLLSCHAYSCAGGSRFDRRDTENSVPAVIVNDTFAKEFSQTKIRSDRVSVAMFRALPRSDGNHRLIGDSRRGRLSHRNHSLHPSHRINAGDSPRCARPLTNVSSLINLSTRH
jgi:putative ABC transport system permease protein